MHNEMLEQLWPIGRILVRHDLQRSGERVVELVETSVGVFVVKQASTTRAETEVTRDLEVLAYLSDHHFRACPRIVMTTARRTYAVIEGRVVYLLHYIEGAQPEANPDVWAKLGEITATLHHHTGFSKDTSFSVVAVRHEFGELSDTSISPVRFLALAETLPEFESLPKTLIHTDIGLGNTLLTATGDAVLVDWDDAGRGARVLDLGFPLICQFIPHGLEPLVFDATSARAFYGRYFALQKVHREERRFIFDAALFYALIYSVYGDQERNWQRIEFALAHRHELETVLYCSISTSKTPTVF